MTDWFRSWHNAPTDAKWRTIAKRAGVKTGQVVAVVWALFDRASQAHDRGSVAGFNPEILADAFDWEVSEIQRVTDALMEVGVIRDDRFVAWARYQPAREDGSAERAPNRPTSDVWRVLRTTVFERDDYTCRYCGDRGGKLECDHVVPVSRGGSHDLDNLVTACFPCNRSKRDKTLDEWLATESEATS